MEDSQNTAALEIRPQAGAQEKFLSTPADIAIYGGAAGGGKSFSILIEPLRHMHVKKFGAVIFRRHLTEIMKEGGLWDESCAIYPFFGARGRQAPQPDWRFGLDGDDRARISFGHLEHESDIYSWHGAQIPLIIFDELTHFTKKQFFYMLSRNRSRCEVRPYIRATCNPDPDSFVAELIEWYINPDTGYPIEERSGVLRYMLRIEGDEIAWADRPEDLLKLYPTAKREHIKSFTFIHALITDNKILLERNPEYLGNLNAQNLVDRERLLKGNWKIRPAAGLYYKRHYFPVIKSRPANPARRVRYWDLAATEATTGSDAAQPDWTVGLLLSADAQGGYCVEHVERFQGSPKQVEAAILNTAAQDGKDVIVGIPQDPGQAGKAQASHLMRLLAGFTVEVNRESGSKIVRAGAASSQAEQGNISIVQGHWNEAFLSELENFPRKGAKDDQVDALSGAFHTIASAPVFWYST